MRARSFSFVLGCPSDLEMHIPTLDRIYLSGYLNIPRNFLKISEKYCKKMLIGGGIKLSKHLIEFWKFDQVVAAVIVKILEKLLKKKYAAKEFLSLGGKILLMQICKIYEADDEIKVEACSLLRHLISVEYELAISELRLIQKALSHEVKFPVAQLMESDKNDREYSSQGPQRNKIHPSCNVGFSEPLKCISDDDPFGVTKLSSIVTDERYRENAKIHELGIETILLYAKKKNRIPSDITCDEELALVTTLLCSLRLFPASRQIQWRGCLAITSLCVKSPINIELEGKGAVRVLVDCYNRFANDDDLKMQCLWAISSLCQRKSIGPKLSTCGFKKIMYDLLICPFNTNGTDTTPKKVVQKQPTIVVPLRLRSLYTNDELIKSVQPTDDSRPKSGIELRKDDKPLYGKVADLFKHEGDFELT
mmetsp:Transcript_45355/g.53108  ORF Transcript_45355/g.53108 Transcript_45355/m.53108 type:complete len:421 (+) Transcript_45355:98-1360(+)